MSKLISYVVLCHGGGLLPADPPFAFPCQAENMEHAEEQALNAYPTASIVWATECASVDDAFADYYRGLE